MNRFFSALASIGAIAVAVVCLSAKPAGAVPAFADQTGEPCQACHVGGFGPQLTDAGREFKLKGYTLRTKSFDVPLSAMAVASYVRTAVAQNPAPAPGFSGNDNAALDQLSLFFATGIGSHLGAFVQATYDGVAKAWHWDNLDLRAATTAKVGATDVVLGVSVNNSPAVQDPWNSLPAWGFPYTSSTLAPSPSASPLMNGALAQTTLGITGYVWANDEIYLEGGGYWSPRRSFVSAMGADPTSPGSIRGVAPYARVAFQQNVGPGSLELGAFGMQTGIYPALDQSTGFVDRYTDLGLDGSYLAPLGSGDTISINARLLHEGENLAASCLVGGASSECARIGLTDMRADASYYWKSKIGLTIQGFDTIGAANPIVYAANRTFRPNSSGVTFQVDGTPFGRGKSPFGPLFNFRVGLQYTAYATFDGASHNFDGLGHNASDNNTMRLFTWVAF